MGNDSTKIINQYVDTAITNAINTMQSATTAKQIAKSADVIAKVFGSSTSLFEKEASGFEEKLITSFQKNLTLLIQKTWVEESDADLKEQVLYQLAEYCKAASKGKWSHAYKDLLKIVYDVVYLMFGTQTKSEDFLEYALRIDPEFGIFWYYIKSLPDSIDWDNEKCRVAMLLGMYFLANY
ncbi:hypothetical protein [Treponema sp.]|uniref:hypothetical protein n=1 Tax=Treponema sp. TaxID=166 RepID=UPI00298D8312|nr:hypothetical protein [Treponema sp.]MCR5613038.1 hypothetical protein [Treponema sp.]